MSWFRVSTLTINGRERYRIYVYARHAGEAVSVATCMLPQGLLAFVAYPVSKPDRRYKFYYAPDVLEV